MSFREAKERADRGDLSPYEGGLLRYGYDGGIAPDQADESEELSPVGFSDAERADIAFTMIRHWANWALGRYSR